MARNITKNGKKDNLKQLAMMMQSHESQRSAAVVATIAILIGNKINTDEMSIDEEC